LNVFVTPLPNDIGKFFGVIKAFPNIWEGSVLDVGCRSGGFKQVLSTFSLSTSYYGVDLYPPADVIANVEYNLPFLDAEFDVVVALDILEHTDNIHKAFTEICRVAKRYVVITLPNSYEIKGRFKFFFGRPLSGKYGLPIEPPKDRHRWLFSLREAREFICTLGRRCGFEVRNEGYLVGQRRSFTPFRVLVFLFPNLLSQWYIALLQRKGGISL